MTSFTFPVDSTPSYDANFTKLNSQGIVISFIRSAANINAPFNTMRNNGVLPSMSLFISSATAWTRSKIVSEVIETSNSLSFIFTLFIAV